MRTHLRHRPKSFTILVLALLLAVRMETGHAGEPPIGEHRLALTGGEAAVGEAAEVALTLTSTVPIQGVVAVFQWDGASGTGSDLVAAPAIVDADSLELSVAENHMVVGVVLDTDGTGANTIPPGEDILLATAAIRCDAPGETNVEFVDGQHPAGAGGPLLDNIVVVEGRSIGATEGLELVDGSFTCREVGVEVRQLALGRGEAVDGANVQIPLTLSSSDDVQGLVAVFEWDAGAGTGIELVAAPAIADADSLELVVAPDHMIVGVIVDSDGTGTNVIPAGDDILLATATIRCDGPGETDVEFVDGAYATSEGGPLQDNIVVIEGLSIGVDEGLELSDGSFRCRDAGVPVRQFALGSDEAIDGANVQIPLTLSSSDDVQGLVAVFEWDAGAGTGIELVAAPAIADADSLELVVAPDHMIVGVIVDTDGTGTNVIPAGDDILLATATIRCDGPGATDVEFVDGAHATSDGGPLQDNIVVIEGLSIGVDDGLELSDGSFRCLPGGDAIEVVLDIKPGSCPNPLNVRSRGVTPAAILGEDGFDVTQIDPTSLRLEGLAPLRWSYEDVAMPSGREPQTGDCRSCAATGLDGFPDLTLKFDTPALAAALGEVSDEECRLVQITGNLADDAGATALFGTDVIRILARNDDRGDDHPGDPGPGDDRPPPPRGPKFESRRLVVDVNGDGIMDIRDPVDVLRYVLGEGELAIPDNGDADRDGDVDPRDALLLLSQVMLER